MGLFENIFGNKQKEQLNLLNSYYKSLTAYTPSFNTFSGGVYEMELTRSAIHAFATQCAKLKPEITGYRYRGLEKKLQFKPNDFMDTYKFMYRIATIFEVDTTAFIVPIYGRDYETIEGYYPILPQRTEIIEFEGVPYLRYTFANGQKAAIELSKVGIMTKFQYKDDFFGSGNAALKPTLSLIDKQRQGIEEGIKQGAVVRFMARLTGTLRPEDITAEKKRFISENLSMDNNGGVMTFDNRYSDIKQVTQQNFIVDAEQMKIINNNVYSYFGVNEDILQNKYNEEGWNAYYESKIESFAVQLGLVLTNMTFTRAEIENGSEIIFTSSRIQYASNKTKLEVSKTLLDRGVLSINQVLDIWNMANVEDGDKRYIRKEYAEVGKLHDEEEGDKKND